jgi:hypothetical protein
VAAPATSSFAAPVVSGNFSPLAQGHSQLLKGAGFEGLNDSQCGCDPPDVQDAAGPNQVVEMVNLYVEVWDQNGSALAAKSLPSFYNTAHYLSDPRVVYDNLSGRFFASILEINATVGTIYFAVSQSSDATGAWTIYKILDAPTGNFPDQPMLGVNATLLGFGGNLFGNSYAGAAEYWVVNKSAVLNGSAAAFASFGPDTSSFSVHPARTIGPSGPLYFVETYGGAPGSVELFQISGIPPATTTVSTTTVSVGAITDPPAAPTPDGGSVDSATPRVADALYSNGRLYLTFGDQCSLGGKNLSCLRYEVLNTTPSVSVFQDFDIALAGTFLYYPALSIDSLGDAVLVFGLSSTVVDPSIAAATQHAGDPIGTISPFVWAHQGTAGRPSSCSPACRFGDFFGSGADPVNGRVWVSGEFLTASTNWQTWIAPVQSVGPSLFYLESPLEADLGSAVPIWLNSTNAPCGPGLDTWCSVTFPYGNGTRFTSSCGQLGSSLQLSEIFAAPGSYPIGTGGSVRTYSSASCSPSSLLGTYSLTATAITIYSAPAVTLSDSNGGAGDVGENVSFAAVLHGGGAISTYNWTGLPTGCLPTNALVVSCAPSSPGSFVVTVGITDSTGVLVHASSSYLVDPSPSVEVSTPRPRVDVGGNLTLVGSASGGSGVYDYGWFGLPGGCAGLDLATLTCSPTTDGTFVVFLVVTDSRGTSASSSFVELTIGAELFVSIALSPTSLSSGASTTVSAVWSGGLGPFTFNWSGLPATCPTSGMANETCSFPSGSYSISVQVTDSAGSTAFANLSASVKSPEGSSGITLPLLILGGVALAVFALAVGLVAFRSRRYSKPPPR